VAVAEALVAERADPRVAVGIGHSFGGTSMLGACVRRPRLFERVVLVDPVTPPPPAAVTTPERIRHLESLVSGARNRRASWPSRAQARDWWSQREFFQGWLPDALDLYVLDGLRDRADGSVELKCPGEIEATIFGASVDFDIFDLARAVTTPALFQWAKRGSFPRPLYEALAACMASARVEDVDCGHLVPMERPDLVVEGVLRFVDGAV
jgi:pimeloyl-ACP methyl ester carboxylesterase